MKSLRPFNQDISVCRYLLTFFLSVVFFSFLLAASRLDVAGRCHPAGHLQRALQAEERPPPPAGPAVGPPGPLLQQLQRQEAPAGAQQEPAAVPEQPELPVTAG